MPKSDSHFLAIEKESDVQSVMHIVEEKTLETIKRYELINYGDNIVVGVSGGPDSMALLNVLITLKEKINFNIIVAHINHGIREEADEETIYVREFCESRNIECYIKKEDIIKISKEQKIGTEEAGRKLRYEFFEEVLKKASANKIATAHTANDNAETVLMNIIRGTGISGLKGIEVSRDSKFIRKSSIEDYKEDFLVTEGKDKEFRVIRPLINCIREEIEEYCKIHKLNPRYDKSNEENIYTRNKVRNNLIPYIEEEFNPNIITSLNRLSEIVTSENEWIQKKVEEEYKEIVLEESIVLGEQGKIILDLNKFNKKDLVIKNRLVLYTINKLFGSTQNIEKIHIQDIIKLCERNIGNKHLTPNKRVKIMVNKGKIFFIKQIVI